jgi:hypothetical protein
MTPADEIRAAVFLLQNPIRRPELCAVVDLPFTNELIEWLEIAAEYADRWPPDDQANSPFRRGALALARAINGSQP